MVLVGVCLLGFAFFGDEESFRAPRWVVAAVALSFMLSGALPLRHAVAEGGIRGEVRGYGRIANTAGALDRLMRKLGGEGVGLRFCYEAGPCGYGIQRHVSAHGHECVVVAPSLIPKRATGSRPIGGMRPVWRGCIGRAS